MKRIALSLAAAAVVLSFNTGSAQAQVGNAPWCAVIENGSGSVYWDCQYSSVEACVPDVLAGNRGFCNHNPYFLAAQQERPRMVHRHKRHHRHS